MLELSLQTWNCFGLPQGVLPILRGDGPPDDFRFAHPDLLAALAAPDILCVQELWMPQAIGPFERLPHPHKLRDETKTRWFPPPLIGAGLGIASRFPIAHSGLRRFPPPHAGPDRLARKGMLHARLVLRESPRFEIDLINAHWQAEREAASRKVRARQMRELAALIAELESPERAFFLCGDFNIDGLAARRADEHDALVRLLPGFQDLGATFGATPDRATFLPAQNALARRYFAHEPEQRLDYIFFRPARAGPRLEPLSVDVLLDQPLRESHLGPETFSSDHFALRARLRLDETA